MNHSVRSLLPSLLLIGIYFIADEFFGTVTGVWVAFLLGGAEFIYTRIREKVYDKMILLTTLFFCIPGLISIWANGSVLSQLQPAIIETALCLLLGFFAFSHTDFTHTLPAGYRKNIHLSGPQLQSMRKMLRILFILVALHTLLAYTAILFLPEDTAKFITTPLLYIILGTYFVVFFIYNRLLLRKMKKGCLSSTRKEKLPARPPAAFVIRDPNYSIPSYIYTLPTIATNYSCKKEV